MVQPKPIMTFEPQPKPNGSYLSNRATQDEILAFCNKVREAGGGEILEALLPGWQSRNQACLIARNLNFECYVEGLKGAYGGSVGLDEGGCKWVMYTDEHEIIRTIARRMDLPIVEHHRRPDRPVPAMLLPQRIGNAAEAFDEGIDYANLRLSKIYSL
jgi:hypothetical protein